MKGIISNLHILAGLALIIIPLIIIGLNSKSRWLKPLSFVTAAIGWLLLLPAGKLYLTFYPETKKLVKSGAWPWAHSIIMETKEHWGLLLPIIATVGAILIYNGKFNESKRWWWLLWIIALSLGIMGRIVTTGAWI